jgi:hypothetical protein
LNGDKVTIKEHHTAHCVEADITEEISLLAKLSHECIPKLAEIFITNISVFMVSRLLTIEKVCFINFSSGHQLH